MNWFLLALIAPLSWSIANYLDKYILSSSKNEENGGSGGLLILSCLVSIIFAFCIFAVQGFDKLILPSQTTGALVFSGMFEALYLIFYFWALERESTTTVISLFQFAPIMGLLFGYLFLSEIPNGTQVFAILLILIGTLFIVYKKGEKSSFKWNILLLMLASTTFVGFYNTLFKLFGEHIFFWTAVFWQYIGIGIIGFIFFVVSPQYQREVFGMLKGRGSKSLLLTGAAELMNIFAILATNAAVLLAPVAIVLAIGSVQPLFVLIEGLIIVKLFPKLLSEEEKPSLKLQYLIGIILVCIGGFIIY